MHFRNAGAAGVMRQYGCVKFPNGLTQRMRANPWAIHYVNDDRADILDEALDSLFVAVGSSRIAARCCRCSRRSLKTRCGSRCTPRSSRAAAGDPARLRRASGETGRNRGGDGSVIRVGNLTAPRWR